MVKKRKVGSAVLLNEEVIALDCDTSREFWHKSQYGAKRGKGSIVFSHLDTLFLVSKDKLVVTNQRNQEIPFDALYKKFFRLDKELATRYPVYADFRERGYVVKTALKFGGDFRVYPKGKTPSEAHAKWIVYPVSEAKMLSWRDFSAKNRVAHSTKKNLLIGVVDDDGDVSYFEIQWLKP